MDKARAAAQAEAESLRRLVAISDYLLDRQWEAMCHITRLTWKFKAIEAGHAEWVASRKTSVAVRESAVGSG